MERFRLSLILCCASLLAGCAHQPTGTTPATAPALTIYQRAAIIDDSAAGDVQIAQSAIINLHKAGKLPDDQYRAIQNIFQTVGNYGLQISKLIAAEASSDTINDAVQNAIHGLVGISTIGLDAQTAGQIKAYADGVTVLLNQILALFPKPVASVPTHQLSEVTPWIQPSSQALRFPLESSSSSRSTLTANSTQPLPLPAFRFPPLRS